jgi:hypothetical protein
MSSAWEPPTIASIVEGDGEVPALPKLLHRIAAELDVPNLLTPIPMCHGVTFLGMRQPVTLSRK